MLSDAHFHPADLEGRDISFFSRIPDSDWIGAAVSHDIDEYQRSEGLRAFLPRTVAGFGIHPQGLRDDTAEFLAGLTASKQISFIGEAGFDFFGDKPERIRSDLTLQAQRKAFEFQLDLALRAGLPLLIHSRRGMDVVMGYGKRLARLPSVIFHGWPGRIHDARAFLRMGVRAYFSFGTTLVRDARHAMETCREAPSDSILAETDAPWQPLRGAAWTGLADIVPVQNAIASLRGIPSDDAGELLRANFLRAFCIRRP